MAFRCYMMIAVCVFDIASFDIYPAAHSKPEVAGNLWYVAKGVEPARQMDRRQKNRLELHRMHADQQPE